ncbi:MAG: PAS domain-containing protein, partial [Methylocystis sp.]|nr:PAS domain-containing protein [Methylocystis sp.]
MTDRTGSPAFDRSERPSNVNLVAALAIAIVAAPAVYFFAPASLGPRLMMLGLALFAVAGVFSLFAYAVGLIQFTNRSARNDVTKLLADSSPDCMLITRGERIIYANQSYMALCGARDPAAIQVVERLFSGPPEVSEAIYRLAQAARGGGYHTEDIRLSPPLTGVGAVGWYRIRVRPLPTPGGAASLWTVIDLTADRERQENVFQELQHAIDFLDHAPAGFFSASSDGAVSYMNKTLANWLGYDLTQVGSGGSTLSSIVANNGTALLAAISGAPGEVKTEQIDLDLRRQDGRSLPVRLLHQIAFG